MLSNGFSNVCSLRAFLVLLLVSTEQACHGGQVTMWTKTLLTSKNIRMKNQDSSYAQLRIGFYENSFQNQTIQQLVDNFNQLANSHGWAAERSYFSMELMNEIIRRGIDVSAIVERDDRSGQILSVRYVVVRLDEASSSLVPLN